MKKKLSPILALLLAVIAAFFGYTGLTDDAAPPTEPVSIVQDSTEAVTDAGDAIDPDGSYTTAEDVALYLYTYGKLPSNFITKKEAQSLGWPGGGLDDYAYGMCIGGDRYGNYEQLLPDAEGRRWTECDIDTLHADSRGPRRIVFSNDGLIYYTPDHYESFELLYGEP
ncbi:MAG: ribonuclease [Oscillospiraceae bacterium]|nr:ribonuclease [Oscillospiraceae bacterium]